MRLLVAAMDVEMVAFSEPIEGFDMLVTGLGKLQAAVGLTKALSAQTYEEIVVVGTAGALDPELEASVYEVVSALQHDVADLDGVVGQHVALPPRVGASVDGVTIATGDRFIDDADAVTHIRALGASLVDMETYAYMWTAENFGVPIRVFKAVSDRAQDGATELWDVTVTRCSGWLRERIRVEYGV
ncbi:adenosylhomocysteine nucleosidase [Microbacterium endophyticum]|uniref:Adenosylhomocysteine nucleosidase n=1 Tax=Microbacterium endophyticum TaxID=1526412 RepID=A0A7W4V3C1_9MICO|nr:nucleoside phosphorylase [Microbacterium endophyticum]MBB2975959.1 adenosylhomocysteine nucleosidase [Microbacterium endophyticum]NIK37672.1 adenosylhomocysteine nucleosidase [Microbacterium endophyticum]